MCWHGVSRWYTDEILGEYHGGFRQSRSNADHIFIIRQILEKLHKCHISLHQLYIYCNRFYQRVARQELCKHGPTCNNEAVFSMSSAPRPVLLTDKSTRSLTRDTCFLRGMCHATIEGLCFLCVVRAEKIEITKMGIDVTWVPKFQGNSSVIDEELEVDLWRLNVWLEDFIFV
jgi:hypothetical protein